MSEPQTCNWSFCSVFSCNLKAATKHTSLKPGGLQVAGACSMAWCSPWMCREGVPASAWVSEQWVALAGCSAPSRGLPKVPHQQKHHCTAPGSLRGALHKGVSWSWIKMSFSWRSASFESTGFIGADAGCRPPASTFFSPLSFCFLAVFVFPSLSILTCLPLSHKEDGWGSPTLRFCFFSLFLGCSHTWAEDGLGLLE